MGQTVTTVSGNSTDAGAKVGVGTAHEADVAALGRLWNGTSVAVAGAAVTVAGIGIARVMAAGVLGLGFAPATATGAAAGLLLPATTSVAPLETLLLAAIATVHAVAAGLAASSMSTSTVARATANRTAALALADGTALALARRNNGRKERWERRVDGRRVATSTAWQIATSSTAGRIVTLALARRVVTFALASASALSFASLALAFAASKFLDEDVVAATYRIVILHGGILSREGVELPTVDDVSMELGGVVGGHIMLMMLRILIGIGGSRSTEEMGGLLSTLDEDARLGRLGCCR